ncbi:hypothetical protein Tco_1481446 [Tanacetum coccineum]
MSLEEFQQPEFEGYGPKASNSVCKDTSNEVKKTPDALLGKKLVSEKEKQIVFPTKIESVKQQEKPARKPVNFDHVQTHCNCHQREEMVNENNYTMVNYNYSAKKAHPKSHKNMTPRAVLMKTGLKPLNTARPVNTAHPKTTVYKARPRSFYTAKPKVVNTARPTSAVVNAVRENQVHPQKEDQGYVDSGCSRHMTGNMSYLTNFKEFDGGYCVMNQTPRKLKRGQDTKIPQSSGPPIKVGDEAVHKELGDRIERAATTASSLEAEQDSGNINRTQSMATLNEQSP